MPSVLLSTSGLDGVLHPVHLQECDEAKSTINPHLPHVYQESLQDNYVAREDQH